MDQAVSRGICGCHGEPRDGDRSCRVKRRERQRRYIQSSKGYLTRRRRDLVNERTRILEQLKGVA